MNNIELKPRNHILSITIGEEHITDTSIVMNTGASGNSLPGTIKENGSATKHGVEMDKPFKAWSIIGEGGLRTFQCLGITLQTLDLNTKHQNQPCFNTN